MVESQILSAIAKEKVENKYSNFEYQIKIFILTLCTFIKLRTWSMLYIRANTTCKMHLQDQIS